MSRLSLTRRASLILATLAVFSGAQAQTASPAAAPAAAASAPVWKYKTPQLDRAAIDRLLARPTSLLVIDVRRPDEITKKGSFPVYLNVQPKEVEQHLAYIPKDRKILTVSNHAARAGAVGDILSAKGYKVAGAAGSETYEEQGGTAVRRILPPAPAASAAP